MSLPNSLFWVWKIILVVLFKGARNARTYGSPEMLQNIALIEWGCLYFLMQGFAIMNDINYLDLRKYFKMLIKEGVGVDNWLFIHAARNNGHGYQAKYGDGQVQMLIEKWNILLKMEMLEMVCLYSLMMNTPLACKCH